MTPEPAGYTWPWLRFSNRMSLDSAPWTAAVFCFYGSAPWTAAVLLHYSSEPWTAAVLLHYSSAPWTAAVLLHYSSAPWTAAVFCFYGSAPWAAAVLLHYSSAPWIAPAAPTHLQSRIRQETSQRACVFYTESWKWKQYKLFFFPLPLFFISLFQDASWTRPHHFPDLENFILPTGHYIYLVAFIREWFLKCPKMLESPLFGERFLP